MAVDVKKIGIFRIIPIENLESDLQNGLFARNSASYDVMRKDIGNKEIIEERNNRVVKCFPGTVVNDYVPFYFSVRTPMLYNIKTGKGVPMRFQKDIVYLCGKLIDFANDEFQWCFTDGNAAKKITRFFNNISDLDRIDWRSIISTDFRTDNADGDEDRIRKKHAEFLVKDHVPTNRVKAIAVFSQQVKLEVEKIVENCTLKIPVIVKPDFYF